jgi:hypothetical protein
MKITVDIPDGWEIRSVSTYMQRQCDWYYLSDDGEDMNYCMLNRNHAGSHQMNGGSSGRYPKRWL